MPGQAQITALLNDAFGSCVFSAYQLHAERRGQVLAMQGGIPSYWGEPRPVVASTRFDIGSVTKAVVTASLLALGIQEDTLSLEDPIGKLLPELGGTVLADRTLGDIASHASGLVGWYPIYDETDRAGLLGWFAANAAKLAPRRARERSEYSDLGFILLGLALERAGGAPLPDLFRKRVAEPLGVTETEYGPIESPEIAATEYCLIRKRVLQGEVFDENCHFLGSGTGHAGLFATTRGIAPFCREWLRAVKGESKWLGPDTARAAVTPSGRAPGGTFGYGWDTPSAKGSSAGDRFSRKSFGHLGYPGCSIWIDPQSEGFVIFFTNRIHPSRYDERIRKLRPALHDAIAALWTED